MENKENNTNDISYVDEKTNDSTDLSASKESLKKVDQVSNKIEEKDETDDGSDEKSNDKRLRFSHMDDIPTVKFRDVVIAKKFGSSPYDSDRVQVEYFSNEKSLKERLRLYFIKNQRSSLRIRVFNFIIKFLTCVLYAIRVNLDDSSNLTKYELPHNNLLKLSPECWNRTWIRRSAEEFRINPCINWDAIVYIKTPLALWIAQVVFAFLSYTQTLLMLYLSYKGNLLQIFSQVSFLLDTLTSFTLIMTIWWPPSRYVYIPIFLNCWLAKRQLENMFNDLNRAIQKSNSAFAQRLMILAVTISCLVFTGSCAIQHFQRGGNKQLSLFESFWYIVVTFSTVGYGDIYPDIWPSQLFMILLIIAALVVLPSQFEQLVLIYVEKQKRGTSYSRQRAETEKHVVVCSTTLQHNIIMDFLNEFYAHPMLQNFYVVLLSPSDLDQNLSAILQTPIWSSRVIYIQGSALNNSDLNRAQIEHAEACFIMAARNYSDRQAADHHTILRSWAIRDFAPNCIQYIHLLKPENKMHVQHAKYVVCEDEFKYALLANNCLCPGLSTFVTLLLHTSRGREGSGSNEEWQKLYGKCSGNEIYHIKLGDSKFFGEYEGKTFTYASFHAHRKFGVALVGVQPENDMIKLNAGPHYVMKSTDICFYMSITKEENSSLLIAASANQQIPDEDLNLTTHFAKKISFRRSSFNVSKIQERVSLMKPSLNRSNSSKSKSTQLKYSADDSHVEQNNNNTGHTIPFSMSTNLKLSTNQTKLCDKNYFIGSPPIPPYVCCSSTICHLLKEKQSLCCLKLNQECPHSKATQVKDYNFEKKAIILASEYSNIAIYNFIVPLRSYSIPKESLNPILLLFEKEPSESFLEIIRYFPLVYWMKGSIDRLEDLLRAGINESEYLIIVNKERSYSSEEQALEDCHTILSVQYIFRMFPKVKVCSEIVDANNMRFMQFRANDQFSLQISKREKIEVEKGSNIAYLFRTPFAGGNVFSATMLDTLLYQSFVKNYLINFVRLMLGIDQAPGSGHLSCKKITTEDSWIRTYGRLYQSLCSTTYDIPVGIYRTDQIPREKEKDYNKKLIYTTNMEISKIVQTRMEILHINQSYYSSEESNEFSYVIMNPSYDLTLKTGDIILIIKPNDLFQEVSTN